MSQESNPIQLSIAGLTHRCAQETHRFFQRQAYDPAYCHELFRRAVVENNQEAHTCIYVQYEPLVSGWVERHPSFPVSGEEVQYFVNRAFEKLWRVLTPEKFARFAELRALLSYLKMCTHSVIVDSARARHHVFVDEEPDQVLASLASRQEDVESNAIRRAQQQAFWQLIDARLNDEKERIVVYGSFVLALKPRDLYQQYGQLFADVKEIYRTKQNVMERLRRDESLKESLGWHA
jgi:hypothetical protein